MSEIILTAGVRQNLLSLQNTADLMATTQNRLATGKKVNTALDNPTSFFMSQSLNNRASDLNSLLDLIGQAQQTLKSADDGISSLTKMVQSAKSIATQALQAPKGTVNYTNITGTATLPTDTTVVSATADLSTAGTVSVQSIGTFDFSSTGSMADGDTVTVSLNGVSKTYLWKGAAPGATEFNSAASLRTLIMTDFGSVGSISTVASNAFTLTSNDLTNDVTITRSRTGAGAVGGTAVAHTLGDSMTISDGTTSKTVYRVAANANTAAGTYTAAASLKTIIDNTNMVLSSGPVATTINGTGVDISRADGGNITFSGAMAVAAGYTSVATTTTYNSNYNTALAALTGNLTIQVGSNAVHTITFGNGSGQIHTKNGLNTALAAFTDLVGSVNTSNRVNLAPTSTDDITIGGAGANLTALGLTAQTTTPTATVITPNSTRTSLQGDFNNLLTQIDQLAKDASYNGVNLLYGDNLKVTFNENGSSSMTILGVKFDSIGLGLTTISGTGFQDDHNVNVTLASLETSLTSLRTQSSKFGSTLTTVMARQDFTKNLISTLQTGADNLVLADTNEEGANMLALQTRQSLSTTALSLANQASQAVLRLFGG